MAPWPDRSHRIPMAPRPIEASSPLRSGVGVARQRWFTGNLPGRATKMMGLWWVYDGLMMGWWWLMMVDGFKKRFLKNLDKPYKPRSGWLDPRIPSLVENESTSFLLFHVPFLQVWGVSREDCVLGKIKSKHCEHVESCWIMLITED